MNTLIRLVTLNLARIVFVASLLLALYVGLTWALAIEDRPDAAAVADAAAERLASESEAAEAGSEAPSAPEDDGAPATTATPTPPPETEDPEELIAAALAPNETTVQVLDAGGGQARVDAVVSALEGFGYEIVSIQSSGRDVSTTTVYWTADDQPQAEALRARDPRFQAVESNDQRLSEGVSIHVLVGADF